MDSLSLSSLSSAKEASCRGPHLPKAQASPLSSEVPVILEAIPDHGAAGPITPGEPVSEPTLGIPERKKTLSALDCTATALSLLCLAAAILIIHPNLPFAVKLGTNKQLTALGFLLGVINQCLQRVLPFLFVLFEA